MSFRLVFIVALAIVAGAACGDDSGNNCPIGALGCACTSGGGCDVGLECDAVDMRCETDVCSNCGTSESARDACFRLCTHNGTATST